MKTHFPLLAVVAILLFTGCASKSTHGTGPYAPVDTTKYTLENTEKFVLMDQAAQYSITCTGLQEFVSADGRVGVVANVKNREARRVQVQISCVFKDAQHFSTGDETPWETLILGENETKAVRFAATNAQAKTYTIRVRQAR